jgi:hypothetical protein
MNKEKQRIAIAKACGWTKFTPDTIQFVARRSDGKWDLITDYLHDLNAMHEAENLVLRSAQQCRDYADALDDGNGGHFATAAQRAEAFIRTIGKWEEET